MRFLLRSVTFKSSGCLVGLSMCTCSGGGNWGAIHDGMISRMRKICHLMAWVLGLRLPRFTNTKSRRFPAPTSEELRDLLISSHRNRCSCQDGDRCQACSAWLYSGSGAPAGWLGLGTDPKTEGKALAKLRTALSLVLEAPGRAQTPRREGF